MFSPHEYSQYTLHIVLATAPQRKEKPFDDQVRQGFYDYYRDQAKDFYKGDSDLYGRYRNDKNVTVLYNPLRFFVLGNFDIAYVALIDNFKFAQKLFEPHGTLGSPGTLFPTHSFQSFTGITYASGMELEDFFYKKLTSGKKYFMSICNLKLNNGFLLGNGKEYVRVVKKKIKETIEGLNRLNKSDIDFLVLHCFSWFEVSVIVFTDNPEDVGLIIKSLRRLEVRKLGDKGIIERSLYAELLPEKLKMIRQANVFADSHTYFGFHADLVLAPEKDPWLQKFRAADIELKTEIEWQLKPGHMDLLAEELEQWQKDNPVFQIKARFLLAGKSDYLLEKGSTKAIDNLAILRLLVQHADNPIYDHARKIRTRVSFKDNHASLKKVQREIISIQPFLDKLAVDPGEMQQLDKTLKALKVSRQIRARVLKIFTNFNNGIQDIILYPFFLDFYIFIQRLKALISTQAKTWQVYLNGGVLEDAQVQDLETALVKRIEIFQEGYNIRMMNCYQFEDITDFDLDFNSSIQQLLSAYSTLAHEIGGLFYKDKTYGPIVQLHLSDTVANYISINYYIHHLTSPEFVFATITKEILNFSHEDSWEFKRIHDLFNDRFARQITKTRSYFEDARAGGLIDTFYLFNDVIRFGVTYHFDFDLFYYWFWTYNLQNASLYDKNGALSETHFRKELFRILFIAEFFEQKIGFDDCPLPELFSYWDRHFYFIRREVRELLEYLDSNSMAGELLDFLYNVLNQAYAVLLKDVPLTESRSDKVKAMLKRFRIKYFRQAPPDFLAYVETVSEIFEGKESTDVHERIEEGSLIALQRTMYRCLRDMYEKNGRRPSLLRRNWETGAPLQSFIKVVEDHLYSVDQTGGLFFDKVSQMNEYFKMSTATLCEIWDFSCKKKKNFIMDQINELAKENENTAAV